ncbi:BatD family protein [Verrucomicrobia bacterium]|nr:BatD family protein [Verrucomicrobiota bacterium]
MNLNFRMFSRVLKPLFERWQSWLLILPLFSFVFVIPSTRAADQVRTGVSLSPAKVPAGETAIYQLQVINGKPSQLPEFPVIDGLEINYAGQQSSSNTRISQGRMVRVVSLIYQWKIVPQKEGVYLIPPLEFKVGGNTLKTQTARLSVSKGIDYSQYAFIQLGLPKREFYEGEPFAFSVDLFEQNARVEKAPDLISDGFVVQRISDNLRKSKKVIGGASYNVWSLDYTARPVRHGELQLGPVDWPAGLVFRQQSRSRSVFDSFFNDMNAKRRNIVLKAAGETLKILPLPSEGRPASFNGAIGVYSMDIEASPKELIAGDPLTIIISISGNGALDSVPMPPIDHWQGFKTYPNSVTTQQSDQTGLVGTRRFEQVVIPQSSDLKAIPPIEFSFFDTNSKKYRSIKHPAIPIQVKANPNAPTMPSQTFLRNGEEGFPKPEPKDVVPIKPFLGEVVALDNPWMMQSSAYGLQLIPLIFLGIALGISQFRERSGKDIRGKRKRHVDSFIRKQVPLLDALAQKNDSDAFFELMFRLMQERLGQCMNLPAVSITESVLDDQRGQLDCSEEDIETLHRLFQACNQARYAPIRSTEQLVQYAGDCRQILTTIN